MGKATVIIPSKNEADNLKILLPILANIKTPIIIIDASDDDKTMKLAKEYKISCYKQKSHGKGGAISEAVTLTKSEILVFIDADCSHDPNDIFRLIEPIENGDADLVIGSRMRGGSDELFSGLREFVRLVGGHIITMMIAKRFNCRLTDSQNGLRAIRAATLRDLQLKQVSFSIETEMCIEALRRGYRVMERRTHEYRRLNGKSNINPLALAPLYGYVTLKGILKPSIRKINQDNIDLENKYNPRWERA